MLSPWDFCPGEKVCRRMGSIFYSWLGSIHSLPTVFISTQIRNMLPSLLHLPLSTSIDQGKRRNSSSSIGEAVSNFLNLISISAVD